MTRLLEPGPAMMLLLADLGPKDEKPASIKRCRKRVQKLRRNLLPPDRKVVSLKSLEAARGEALRALDARCAICGHCILRSSEPSL